MRDIQRSGLNHSLMTVLPIYRCVRQAVVRKTPFLEPSDTNNAHFTQTGSGQT
jgi:hypothetical protein